MLQKKECDLVTLFTIANSLLGEKRIGISKIP